MSKDSSSSSHIKQYVLFMMWFTGAGIRETGHHYPQPTFISELGLRRSVPEAPTPTSPTTYVGRWSWEMQVTVDGAADGGSRGGDGGVAAAAVTH